MLGSKLLIHVDPPPDLPPPPVTNPRHLSSIDTSLPSNHQPRVDNIVPIVIGHEREELEAEFQGGSLSQPMMVDNANMTTTVRAGSDESKARQPQQLSMQFNVDGLKNNDVKILEYLQQHANNEQIKEEIREKGVHRDELARQLKIPMEKILDFIKNLEDEGLVYSTIDDYHFKIAALVQHCNGDTSGLCSPCQVVWDVLQVSTGVGLACSLQKICYHVLGLVHEIWTPIPRAARVAGVGAIGDAAAATTRDI
ncbi:hypothetical protein ACFE04_020620 [Oxalis oulophora]